MQDKSSNQSQENNETPPIEEWRLHALANRLGKAHEFEARPEFNAELRSRLLNRLEPKDNHSASFRKARSKAGWSDFSGLPVWGGLLPQSLMLGLVIVLGLVVVLALNLKLPTPASVPGPTVVASVTPDVSGQEKTSYSHLVSNENLLIIKERLDEISAPKTDYSDTIASRLLYNMIKKEIALTLPEEINSFDRKFDYRPVPS